MPITDGGGDGFGSAKTGCHRSLPCHQMLSGAKLKTQSAVGSLRVLYVSYVMNVTPVLQDMDGILKATGLTTLDVLFLDVQGIELDILGTVPWKEVIYFIYLYFKTGGTYVEAGAHNGLSESNSLYLELALGWTGLLVEPNPERFQNLTKLKRRTRMVFAECNPPGPLRCEHLADPLMVFAECNPPGPLRCEHLADPLVQIMTKYGYTNITETRGTFVEAGAKDEGTGSNSLYLHGSGPGLDGFAGGSRSKFLQATCPDEQESKNCARLLKMMGNQTLLQAWLPLWEGGRQRKAEQEFSLILQSKDSCSSVGGRDGGREAEEG
ncbi:unnamed protein product [Notodromas monacha]|uniref:Methyltransferase FkbM domain-containing protein n=1 Tax=Notodromas monacha TaxID=399045 RepID=A0A7R9BUC8_9CRUS|nr:unnamed protein product [Notodromas monacha]CAG0921921.1 unnamed protein product [Notodromas monacha]